MKTIHEILKEIKHAYTTTMPDSIYLCKVADSLYYQNILTEEEVIYFKDYIVRAPDNESYYLEETNHITSIGWESYNRAARIEWLNKHIELTKSQSKLHP